MKVERLKSILAEIPDNARIFQPKNGCLGVLLIKVNGVLLKSIDISESDLDNRPHKQKNKQKKEKNYDK